MSQGLGRRQLKSLKTAFAWIELPAIFIAYFCVLIYFLIFKFSALLLIAVVLSWLVLIWQNGLKIGLKLFLILLLFAGICGGIRYQENKAFVRESPVTQVTPILDTITVNGDQLSFRGKSGKNIYQVYYQLTSEKEQTYFKTLDQGVRLDVSGEIKSAEKQRNFNGFDYQDYLKTQNIYRILTIDRIKTITKTKEWSLARLRRQAILFTETHFPRPMSAYMTGLLFGYLGKDFDEMGSIYSSLGIMHLFALSGMQVGFFIDFLRRLLLRFGIRQDYVAWLQIPISIVYAGMTGFSVSVIRSLIQKMLANFGVKGLDNFSLTLLCLFIVMPKFLLTTGGTLSLLFAFIIAMFGRRFEQMSHVKALLAESLVLSFSVLPLLMLYFHSFQPLSMLLTFVFSFLFDVLFLPGLSLIFLLAMVTGFSLTQVNFLFQWLESLIKLTDSWCHYPLVLGKPTALVFLLMLILTGFLLDTWSIRKARYGLLLSLSCLFFLTKNPPNPSLTLVDIGQGDSIFLQDSFNRHTILIDTGGKIGFSAAEKWRERLTNPTVDKTLIPFLKSQGVGQIETLVLTHTDADHTGDLLALVDQIQVKTILVSEGSLTNPKFVKSLKATHAKIEVARVGQRLKIFDSYLQVLSPWISGDGKNDDSIVLYGKLFETKFLFTGDLEEAGEAKLLAKYPNLSVDVLKAGHHGSKTSSSDTFIKQIQPKIGLISCGQNNRYGHPNIETLETFKQYGVKTLRTDQLGAIKFEKNSKTWHISTVK